MTEPVDWSPDGTPHNARFGDIYNSSTGGREQARHVFLQGCGLPAAWAGQAQWRVLETGFGLGLNFLSTWQAWRADPARPRLLHFASVEAWPVAASDIARAAARWPELAPLAEQLRAQWWGLLPGVHRLSFENGCVLLTLAVGDVQPMLREQHFEADTVFLDGFSPQRNPQMWSLHTLKAVARLCRRGTRLASWTIARQVRDDLAQCGFSVRKVPGLPPKRDALEAVYEPAWEPRRSPAGRIAPAWQATRCAVVGAGLAGAAVAASLARRGWQVQVLDAAQMPAAGASGAPVGLFAPHVSPDDAVLSRLSRSGVRATLQAAGALLSPGDWSDAGVLEHRVDGSAGLPSGWPPEGLDWSERAGSAQLGAAGLAADACALWHRCGGWIRPRRLVEALLAQPGIAWQGSAPVHHLQFVAGQWRLLDAQGGLLAEAPLVVLATGAAGQAFAPQPLAGVPLPLQPIRGQLSWLWNEGGAVAGGPPFAVNGHGHFIADVPIDGRSAWCAGATFEREDTSCAPRPQDHVANLQRLRELLPSTAQRLSPRFEDGSVQAWVGVRCAAPDRLPLVGALDEFDAPSLQVCTALGSRGLTLALLCGELLAAQLHAEPLPLPRKLVRALSAGRYAGTASGASNAGPT